MGQLSAGKIRKTGFRFVNVVFTSIQKYYFCIRFHSVIENFDDWRVYVVLCPLPWDLILVIGPCSDIKIIKSIFFSCFWDFVTEVHGIKNDKKKNIHPFQTYRCLVSSLTVLGLWHMCPSGCILKNMAKSPYQLPAWQGRHHTWPRVQASASVAPGPAPEGWSSWRWCCRSSCSEYQSGPPLFLVWHVGSHLCTSSAGACRVSGCTQICQFWLHHEKSGLHSLVKGKKTNLITHTMAVWKLKLRDALSYS